MFKHDIPHVVRAMDNVVDVAEYPLPEQEKEAKNKRRMGLGVTGLANAGEVLGYPYGSDEFILFMESVLAVLRDTAYETSVSLAIEKGPFPLFDREKYGNHEGSFFSTLPDRIKGLVTTHGLRNSHLLSIAPTGTISLSADNVSSGLEPVFSHSYDRTIQTFEGPKVEKVEDYGYRVWGVGKENGPESRTANNISVFDHVRVLTVASYYIDSACSKTCNVGDNVTWSEFKDVYMRAYEGGASGCTTFRAAGKRYGILNASSVEDVAETSCSECDVSVPNGTLEENSGEGGACYFDPATGTRSCE